MHRFLALGIVFMLLLPVGAKADVSPRVLLLSSYHPGFPTFMDQVHGLKNELDAHNVKLDVEFMDSKRFFNEKNYANLTRLLTYKLQELPPYDVLVVADDNALNYAVEHRKKLFRDTPMVFLGINDVDNAMRLVGEEKITGVIEAVSMEQTIGLMRHVLPELKNIVVLSDATPSGQGDLKRFKKLMSIRGDTHYSVLDLSKVRWADVPSLVKHVSSRDAILVLSPFRDSKGETKTFAEGFTIIRDNARCPIFHLWEHGIGDGMLGGKVISFKEQGRLAGKLAVKIIDGANPASLPVIPGGDANVIMFDWNVMKRFDIPRSLLPEDSVILNYEPTLWEDHTSAIIQTGIIIGCLVMVIGYLLRLNRIKDEAERKAWESEKKYRTYIDGAPDPVFVYDSQGVIIHTNHAATRMTGYPQEELDGMIILSLMPSAIREQGVKDFDTLRKVGRFGKRYQFLRRDGAIAYIQYDAVRLSADRYIGFAKDVSEERQAQRALAEREGLFRGLLEQAWDAVYACDMDGRLLFVNTMACQSLGYRHEELLELRAWDIDPLLLDARERERLWAGDSVSYESVHRRKDGTTFPVESKTGVIMAGKEKIILALARDISRRKEKEIHILRESEINLAQSEIVQALTTTDATIETVAQVVYDWGMRLTGSRFAYVGSIDPPDFGLYLYNVSTMKESGCTIKHGPIVFHKQDNRYPALWGDSLNTGKSFFTNAADRHPLAQGVPEGHVPIKQFLAVPCFYEGELVGQIGLANPGRGYTEQDLATVEVLGGLFALAVYRKRIEAELLESRQFRTTTFEH